MSFHTGGIEEGPEDERAAAVLREQLTALVAEPPAVAPPGPALVVRARRARRQRQAVGALAVAAAVVGGVLVGVDRPGAAQPGPASGPVPACPATPLPQGWSRALASPAAYRVPHGTVVAATPDGSRAYVLDGRKVLELSGPGFGRQRLVLELPSPGTGKDASWTVNGNATDTWFVFSPVRGDAMGGTGLYAWNAQTGRLRTALSPQARSGGRQVLAATWVLGGDHLVWARATAAPVGGTGDESWSVLRLSDGAQHATGPGALFLDGDTLLVSAVGAEQGRMTARDVWTGRAEQVPPVLAKAFHSPNGTVGQWVDNESFAWTYGSDPAGTGPRTLDAWDAAGRLTTVTAPAGHYVSELAPIGDGFALLATPPLRHDGPVTGLVDLRTGGTAELTKAQAAVLTDQEHVLPLARLSRLPGCASSPPGH